MIAIYELLNIQLHLPDCLVLQRYEWVDLEDTAPASYIDPPARLERCEAAP